MIWSHVPDTYIPVNGYKLYMDSGNNGEYSLVFDGYGSPGILYYLASGLQSGTAYRFKVRAMNFNGDSPDSDEFIFYTCLAPSNLSAPVYDSSTTTTLTLSWSPPSKMNGCPLY